MEGPKFHVYYIGELRLIPLMMKIDADMVMMTVPDLELFHLKRSIVRKDIEYVYVEHGIGSDNLLGRPHSLDHYDTIFNAGPIISWIPASISFWSSCFRWGFA